MVKKLTKEQFINKAVEVHGDKYIYSLVNYVNTTVKVKIICKEHGIFEQSPNAHITQEQGCPPCSLKSRSLQRTLTQEQFINTANKVHQFKYTYDKAIYINSFTKIIITCSKHGDFNQLASSHLQGMGCKDCGIELRSGKMSYSLKEFVKIANEIHQFKYSYDNTVYVNSYTKIIITCHEHGDFSQTPDSHINHKSECPRCAHILNTEDFIKSAKEIHGDKYDYSLSEYVDSKTPIKIKCPVHGIFEQLSLYHISGKNGCQPCSPSFKLTTKTFIEKAMQIDIHKDKYTYDNVDYTGSTNKVIITCLIHGDFPQTPADHLSGYGCPRCGKCHRHTTEEFIDACNKIHNFKFTYEKTIYKKSKDYVIITCPEHGDFKQIAKNHLRGVGCLECSIGMITSKAEIAWLNSINVPEEYRHKIIKINDRRFDVDAHDLTTNTIYEFNGSFWHGDPRKHNPDDINHRNHKIFGELYQKTLDREQFIKDAGYNMIVMWEYDWKLQNKKESK
jgi:uncharacterized C2H2 Zn-finger protein